MRKVLYVITSLAHKRVFESFIERKDMDQMVVGPHPKITVNISEDYSDFGIKKIKYYNNPAELQKLVDNFKPDIFVQASLPVAQGIRLSVKCKKVYCSHGLVGNHVKGILKKLAVNSSVWKGNDLYCGATKVFDEWVRHVAKVGSDKILINAIPQLDIIHNPKYYESYRKKIMATTKNPNADQVILFTGFCCKDRYDFNKHNEDYFRTVVELEKLARKYNWLVMVKPRQTYKAMMKFLATHKWGKKYSKQYTAIQNSKYLHFITTTGHIYKYFFADVFVINGTSTIEVEACVVQKPIFAVRTMLPCDPDAYDLVKDGAEMPVPDIYELEHDLISYFKSGKFHYPIEQEKCIKKMGLTIDGKMHQRIQNRLVKM